jgi:AcrR family transcriptional regulator
MDIERLPKNLVLLYEPRDTNRRGPRPALSLEAVVKVGIEIADAEGLAGVSMSKVAERLGFTTMSLYRYVKSKDELLLLMADSANGEHAPTVTTGPWRESLSEWATGIFGTYRRHPWLLQVAMSGPPAGPSQLLWMEAGLRALAEVDVHIGTKLQIIQLAHGYARGEAQLSTDLGGLDPSADTHTGYGDILRAVVNAQTHPQLSELVASGIFDGPTEYDEEIDFGFGLTTILDGIEQLISSPPA